MRRIMNLVLVMGMVAVLVGPLAGESALAAALTSNDFLKADGSVLRNGNGTGDIVNLRGTNLGGWLTFEDWMSPLGEFALDRSDWSATSSAGTASNMLDGDLTTRMSSGATQSGAEWVQLDLGAPTLMDRILIDAGSWTTGWPAEYEVLVSDDASTWRSVARADGTPPATVTSEITTTGFAPQIARYVRVKQLGSKSQY